MAQSSGTFIQMIWNPSIGSISASTGGLILRFTSAVCAGFSIISHNCGPDKGRREMPRPVRERSQKAGPELFQMLHEAHPSHAVFFIVILIRRIWGLPPPRPEAEERPREAVQKSNVQGLRVRCTTTTMRLSKIAAHHNVRERRRL